jgi:hypothetical protein
VRPIVGTLIATFQTCVTRSVLAKQMLAFDVVKIKELMGHASIVTTMSYIHATDQGKRGAITVLSEYRQKRRHKFVTDEKRQAIQPAVNH